MDVKGTYGLVNKTGTPIDSIHVATVHGLETGTVSFSRSSSVLLTDEYLNHHIYLLEKPLEPGDTLQMNFEVHLDPRGFRNTGINRSIVPNGSYFTEGDERWMPKIGYQPDREILVASARRKYKLPKRPLLPSLNEVAADAYHTELFVVMGAFVRLKSAN